jgi:hypothetical protein
MVAVMVSVSLLRGSLGANRGSEIHGGGGCVVDSASAPLSSALEVEVGRQEPVIQSPAADSRCKPLATHVYYLIQDPTNGVDLHCSTLRA